jgi:hypothetical protein
VKIRKPYEAGEPSARPLSAAEKARAAAIEKQLSRYLVLSCGHMQTLETSERYAFAALSILGVLHLFCERCNDFATIAPKEESPEYPEEPLF